VEEDEEEEDDPRHALNGVEPVARVGVAQVVRARLPRDEEAVDRVVQERDEDERDLDEQDVGDGLQVGDGLVEVGRAALRVRRLRVGVEVLQQERAERHDARQLVQLAQHESSTQTNSHNLGMTPFAAG
jgi:hypothetical protein